MFTQMTLWATDESTGSPASQDGKSPLTSPAGRQTAQSGQPASRVSPGPQRAALREWATSGTFGPLFEVSSPSSDLQRLLESRLRARMDVHGSPEYALTWKRWAMPSGLPICALRASARRTLDNGSTGWPTPMAGTPAQKGYHEAGSTDSSRKTVALLIGWNTPRATDGSNGGPNQAGGALPHDASLAGWAAPNSTDHKNRAHPSQSSVLGVQTIGLTPSSFPAPTASTGASRLNPSFSLWLMGYPVAEWVRCAALATPSSRKSPPCS